MPYLLKTYLVYLIYQKTYDVVKNALWYLIQDFFWIGSARSYKWMLSEITGKEEKT